MISSTKFETMPLYKLHFSKTVLAIEVFILTLIFISIVQLLHGAVLVLTALLFVLLCIRFFRTDSICKKFPPGSALEIRKTPERLIWYDQEVATGYAPAEIKTFITRWFILLQLGKGKSGISKLLLADSFADFNHYTSFRRQLIEMNIC